MDASERPDDETIGRLLKERREFLAGLAATAGGLFAGCSGDSDGGSATDGRTSTGDGTPEETATPTPAPVEAPKPDPANYEASPAVPPEQSLETFRTPQWAEVELVASEPLIYSPVDVEWDERGRMWIVEMPDYMGVYPGDGKGGQEPGNYGDYGNAELSRAEMTGFGDAGPNEEPTGRVVVLEDPDDDGRMESATVFRDGLTLPRSIAFTDDGVLIGLPDRIIHFEYDPDTLEPRSRRIVEEGYAAEGGQNENPEHTDNGLLRGIDNWLYNANSHPPETPSRYRFDDGGLLAEETHRRGQWGIAKDDYGRLYYTKNSRWLFADVVPGNGEYLLRDDASYADGIGMNPGDATDPAVYTARENYGTNRAFNDGYHRDDGRMQTITGVAGPGIYRDDLLPDEGAAFVSEPAGNAVAEFTISGGADYLDIDATHERYDDPEWGDREFLASTNEVFRPIYAKTGPDGALYVVDMHRGIFQHVRFLTDYLAEYILNNDLHKVPPSGRIYRVVPKNEDPRDVPDLGTLAETAPEKLADALEHSNGRVRDTAQRLFVEKELTDGGDAVRAVARTSDLPLARVHALWALHGMGEIDAQSVFSAMDADHARVTQAAIRTGEALLETDDAGDYVDEVVRMGTAADQDQRVVVQAAYSLGEVTDGDLQPTAEDALGTIRDVHGGDAYVAEAIDSAPGTSA